MSDAQRDMVQILKDMKRSMDEQNREMRKIGETFARAAAMLRHPSAVRRFPDMKLVPNYPIEKITEIPVSIDWDRPEIKGLAKVMKNGDGSTVIEITVFNGEDTRRLDDLIENGYAERLLLSSLAE